jgi:hypothetical protein
MARGLVSPCFSGSELIEEDEMAMDPTVRMHNIQQGKGRILPIWLVYCLAGLKYVLVQETSRGNDISKQLPVPRGLTI